MTSSWSVTDEDRCEAFFFEPKIEFDHSVFESTFNEHLGVVSEVPWSGFLVLFLLFGSGWLSDQDAVFDHPARLVQRGDLSRQF